MRLLPRLAVALLLASLGGGLLALQSGGWGQYFGRSSSGDSSYPAIDKAEFSWSRLRYTPIARNFGGYGGYGGFGGYGGYGRGSWSTDYPKADRQFLIALKRLTRIDGRSTEQVVDLDTDDINNYPWVYAVQ